MGAGLGAGDEAGADTDTIGAGCQCRRESTWRGDATGSQHGDIDSIEHFGEERQQADHASGVAAAGFHAVGHDEVAAGFVRGDGFFGRGDLPAGQGAVGVDNVDEFAVGGTEKEIDEGCAGSDHVEDFAVDERHEIVHAVAGEPALLDGIHEGGHCRERRGGDAHHGVAAGADNGSGEVGCGDRATHRRELDGHAAPDELRESRPKH